MCGFLILYLVRNLTNRPFRGIFTILLFLYAFIPYANAQSCEDSVELYSLTAPGYRTFTEGSYKLQNGYRCNLFTGLTPNNTTYILGLSDQQGRFLRAKKIRLTTNEQIYITCITDAPENGLVCYGFVHEQDPSYMKGIWVMRLDSNLQVLWSKLLHPNFTNAQNLGFFLKAIHCDEKGNVSCSFTLITGGYHPRNNFFVNLDAAGGIRWSQAAPDYFGKDFGININAITTISDKIYFLGSARNDTTINFGAVPRPGFVSFVFDQRSGGLVWAKKTHIPYLSPYAGTSGSTNGEQVKVFPFNGRFRYAFQESRYQPPVADENNFIVFDLDSNLSLSNAFKLKGYISGLHHLGYGFSKNREVAVANRNPSTNFAVLDSGYQLILSKNIGTGIFPDPDIVKLDIDDKHNLSLGINQASPAAATMQVDVPLYGKLPAGACLGKDTGFFSIELVSLHTYDMPLPLVRDVVQSENVTVETYDYTMQKQELCKVKTVCNFFAVSGDSSFCINTVHTYTARKNKDCLREVVWEMDTSALTVETKTDSSISIRVLRPWSGYVKAKLNGCVLADSIFLTVHQPVGDFSLGKDTTLCQGDSIRLSAPPGLKRYRWQSGDTTSSIRVKSKGTYGVRAWDFCGNEKSDTVIVNISNQQFAVGKDAVICLSDTLSLPIDPRFKNYVWLPSYTDFFNQNFYLSPTQSTVYSVQAEDEFGCEWTSQFSINVQKCNNKIWFPTAFSPNRDGKNDRFKPSFEGRLEFYQLSVYNRWGEKVFGTTEQTNAWDGYWRGALSPVDVYAWLCHYKFRNEPIKTQKGTLSLLR